jgi:hypothetical protein
LSQYQFLISHFLSGKFIACIACIITIPEKYTYYTYNTYTDDIWHIWCPLKQVPTVPTAATAELRGHERLRVVEAERSRDEFRGVQHGAGRGELRNEGIEATPLVILHDF